MDFNEITYFSLLAEEDEEYCRQVFEGWTSDRLMETIRSAHSMVDHGYMSYDDVQALIRLCVKPALSFIPDGSDDFSPPSVMTKLNPWCGY